jgi:hypothetical protein
MPPYKEARTCPCKLLPRSLSSFTAAEYGDLHALAKLGRDIATRKDDFGYTPLHLAAQNNHVAATALLLQLGCHVDGDYHDNSSRNDRHGSSCGATPLHRAAFSGATTAMKLLLEWGNHGAAYENSREDIPVSSFRQHVRCDLLAKDTSFGDESTPLHKAAAGGRYLAVHMLLEALRERDRISGEPPPSTTPSTFQLAIQMKDKLGNTPLEVARHYFNIQESERHAVARWDEVAGGVPDWGRCVELLEQAERQLAEESSSSNSARNRNIMAKHLPKIPGHLTSGANACLDCDSEISNGRCLTASWEISFQKVLGESANSILGSNSSDARNPEYDGINMQYCGAVNRNVNMASIDIEASRVYSSKEATEVNSQSALSCGVLCGLCQKPSFALYPVSGGSLVCKACRRFNKA